MNIIAVPFDLKLNYAEVSTERVDVLLLKIEKMGELWPIVSNFVGREVLPQRVNLRSNLLGGETYDAVRSRISLAPKDVERIYDSEWMKHFYSQEEIESLIILWSNKQN